MDGLRLTRVQLAEFLKGDQEAIRKFEEVFRVVDKIAPNVTEEVAIAAANANARSQQGLDLLGRIIPILEYMSVSPGESNAQQALDKLERIAVALEMLSVAPLPQSGFDSASISVDPFGSGQENIDLANVVHKYGNESVYDLKTFISLLTAKALHINGTAGGGYMTFAAQSANPTAPAAGITLVHAETTQGFTRLAQDNEAATNIILGRDSVVIAGNASGSSIPKGSVVYVSGSTGNVPNIALARADSASTLPAVYVVVDTIANNAFGQVMRNGIISNFDTSAFAAGAPVWVSTTTAGALTSTRPSGANFVQRIGTILVSGVGNGSIDVSVAPAILNMETGTNYATFNINSGVLQVGGTQVVGSRKTGWAAWTGTADRATYAAYTAGTASAAYVQAELQSVMDALQNVSRSHKALIDDLFSTAGHGLLGA